MSEMNSFPIRCKIIDPMPTIASDPSSPAIGRALGSLPHIGKRGWAHLTGAGDVRIHLDDGTIIGGHECWWTPVEEKGV